MGGEVYVGGMRNTRDLSPGWAPPAIVTGGLFMAGIWVVFTLAHGATSFNEERVVLGHDMHFWGLLLGVVPNVLIALGLINLRPLLTAGGKRLAEVGHTVVCIALLVSAAADLAVQALGAPFFMPVVGVGLVLLAAGNWSESRLGATSRILLWVLGVLLLVAVVWAFVPQEFSDSIGGFRIFGVGGYFVAGLVWAALGATLSRTTTAQVSQSGGTV